MKLVRSWRGVARTFGLGGSVGDARDDRPAFSGPVVPDADTEGRRIAEVARTTVIIDPARGGRRLPPWPPLRVSQTNPFLDQTLRPMRVRHYLVPDAVLDASTMILLAGGRRLRETAYCLGQASWGGLGVHDDALVDGGAGRVVIGANLWSANYFHWIVQSLPAIDAALRRRDRSGLPVSIALHGEHRFQTDSLVALGWGEVPRLRLEGGRQYALGLAEYSQFLSGEAIFGLSTSEAATFARLRARFPRQGRPGGRIYVARTDAAARRMRSEAVLVDRLAAAGFEIVVPGTLSFAEQAATFRRARLVVGAHGAGMTNIIFCEPGTFVYELMPAHNVNGCYRKLAALCGLPYWADAYVDPHPGEGPPHLREWDVDPDHALRRAEEIIRHLG